MRRMTDKERMMELVDVFEDADRRGRLSEEELAACPTIGEVLDAWAEA